MIAILWYKVANYFSKVEIQIACHAPRLANLVHTYPPKMRSAAIPLTLAALVGVVLSNPIPLPGNLRSILAARQYPGYSSFPGFSNDGNNLNYGYTYGSNAQSGDAGDANGGSVTNDAGADGTIDNTGASCACVYVSSKAHMLMTESCCSSRWSGW